MDTTSTQPDNNQVHKSELDKFKLFYEFAVTNREARSRIKRQNSNSR